MKGRFSEESREPGTNIKIHKKSGLKPQGILIFANEWDLGK